MKGIRLRPSVLPTTRPRIGLDNLRSAKTPCTMCPRLCRTDANGHFCSTMCANAYAAKKAKSQ